MRCHTNSLLTNYIFYVVIVIEIIIKILLLIVENFIKKALGWFGYATS